MMNMKYIENLLLLSFVLLLSSCKEKTTIEEIEESVKIKIGSVNTSIFTAAVSGSFDGISNMDIALGKNGVLYCEKSDNAQDIFNSWKDGNDNPDCKVSEKGQMNGVAFSGRLLSLKPDTEYNYCLFSQNRDNTERIISSVQSFRTLPFSPEIQMPIISDIHYIDAVATDSVTIDKMDVQYCKMELLLSETTDVQKDGSFSIPLSNKFDGTAKVEIKDIKPNTEYFCRLYIKYETTDGITGFIYGPENSFKTKDLMETAIDLGLPSGIRWADFSMGEYEFASALIMSPYYYWGSSQAGVYYLSPNGEYESTHVQDETVNEDGSLNNIGDEISGTEYDVVHKKYGGKWRMPTRIDLEELLDNCSLSAAMKFKHTYTSNNLTTTMVEKYVKVMGNNGQSIRFRQYDGTWSGTMDDDGTVFGLVCRIGDKQAKMTIDKHVRGESTMPIRPVWDPNMKE